MVIMLSVSLPDWPAVERKGFDFFKQHSNSLGMLAHTCNPSSQVAEAGESQVQGPLGLHNTPLSLKQNKRN